MVCLCKLILPKTTKVEAIVNYFVSDLQGKTLLD